ncbi:hypothetical protein BD769DRAFT_1096157 [Suillus cothurnatus]|nr:hypothetical protein BD769DRAFT_1096157 [Suillus cothurnatus]
MDAHVFAVLIIWSMLLMPMCLYLFVLFILHCTHSLFLACPSMCLCLVGWFESAVASD